MAVIDRIKFDAPSPDLLVWKYPSEEIRMGAQLIVNQSQEVVFVASGQVVDLFGPGTHTLTTANFPLLGQLVNLPFGGESPFTAEAWYVNKAVRRGLKWGTRSPIPLVDPVYNYPVSVRAYGEWGLRVKDSRLFVAEVVGTLRLAASSMVEEYFMGEMVQRLSDAVATFIAEEGLSVFQVNTKLDELSDFTRNGLDASFGKLGIELVNFNVERISLPDEEQKRFQDVLGRRMEIEQLSSADVGAGYTSARAFDVLDRAAANEKGDVGATLGLGVGLGAGLPLGGQIAKAVTGEAPPGTTPDPVERLRKLKALLEGGLIDEAEFESKKKQIMDGL